jgi:recombination protein RecR
MRRFPDAIQELVNAFSRLPGVGPKTALRYVYHMLRLPKADSLALSQALAKLHEKINVCPTCYTYTEKEVCEICSNLKRDVSTVCVVEHPRDISTIESTDEYNGYYHVLGGVLNPLDGITPETLRIQELLDRIQVRSEIKEVLLALSPTVQGEVTMLYLTKQLQNANVRVTKLARGLPTGATLEFADELTLADAIKGRRDL